VHNMWGVVGAIFITGNSVPKKIDNTTTAWILFRVKRRRRRRRTADMGNIIILVIGSGTQYYNIGRRWCRVSVYSVVHESNNCRRRNVCVYYNIYVHIMYTSWLKYIESTDGNKTHGRRTHRRRFSFVV